MIYVGSNLREI
jgi:hypothetical protein